MAIRILMESNGGGGGKLLTTVDDSTSLSYELDETRDKFPDEFKFWTKVSKILTGDPESKNLRVIYIDDADPDEFNSVVNSSKIVNKSGSIRVMNYDGIKYAYFTVDGLKCIVVDQKYVR